MKTSLQERLASVLPDEEPFEVYHVQSFPKEIKGFVTKTTTIYKSAVTVKIQHFLSLAYNNKVFLAVEVNVYLVVSLFNKTVERYIFVSKADTNGYNDTKIKTGSVVCEFLNFLISIDSQYYLDKIIPAERCYPLVLRDKMISKRTTVKRALKILSSRAADRLLENSIKKELDQHGHFYSAIKTTPHFETTTKICLFTRPEPQYLFAESSKNSKKHILTGEQLLRWWLAIVNKLLIDNFKLENSPLRATLQIPGEDNYIVQKRYLDRLRVATPVWTVGSIFGDSHESLYKMPFFPDDPKTRFLKDLIDESRYKSVDLHQYWQELSIRQEFRLGIVVGVIGVAGVCKHRGLYPGQKDVYVPSSLSKFKTIKRYIVGEEYDCVDGAIDACCNMRALYRERLNTAPLVVVGKMQASNGRQNPTAAASHDGTGQLPVVHDLNTLVVRRKKK